uniref:Uncharacterized protein n=1 Tax=Megaselia scalaris TaxID=36166 RepID=T1GEF5_MEGSC
MMKRRWSNNGGGGGGLDSMAAAYRMLEESSSEVTSSSNAMVMSSGLSPQSLSSADYGDQDMWSSYDDHNTSAYHQKHQQHPQQNNHQNHNNHHHPYQHSVITSANNVNSQFTVLPPQTTIYPLPSMQNNNSVNGNSGVMNGNGHLNHHTPRSDSANSISSGECPMRFL